MHFIKFSNKKIISPEVHFKKEYDMEINNNLFKIQAKQKLQIEWLITWIHKTVYLNASFQFTAASTEGPQAVSE